MNLETRQIPIVFNKRTTFLPGFSPKIEFEPTLRHQNSKGQLANICTYIDMRLRKTVDQTSVGVTFVLKFTYFLNGFGQSPQHFSIPRKFSEALISVERMIVIPS